ncbi:MAG: ribbon-helix-helix protein, CopG family [Bryobacterales bacterium]|nr:ribbon-helix-helix protein, CopG family [Bryobacterales bacterium]MDE0296945.1 ribbon-helix-helix protein, CopG family [Bryobacterales bacterium]
MAVTTIKSTYSLDVESVRALETLAWRWNVSKSEVLRRAIRLAVREGGPGESAALGALDRLQASLRDRKVDVARWSRDLKNERRAASRRLPLKPQ